MTYFTSSVDKFGRCDVFAATSCLNHLCERVGSCYSCNIEAFINQLENSDCC